MGMAMTLAAPKIYNVASPIEENYDTNVSRSISRFNSVYAPSQGKAE